MYKRLSSHLPSLDLPDFPDLPDALRETANRMETALHQAKTTYDSHQAAQQPARGAPPSSAKAARTQIKTSIATQKANSSSNSTSIVRDAVNLDTTEQKQANGSRAPAAPNTNNDQQTIQPITCSLSSPISSKVTVTQEVASFVQSTDENEIFPHSTRSKSDSATPKESEVDPDEEYDCLM